MFHFATTADVPASQSCSMQVGLGRKYIAGMTLAGAYAYAGREWVIERVRGIIGGSITDTVHNHHNYAWREMHGGRALWVVRKGATPAFPGQRGSVGGSMGDDAVILSGVESAKSAESLYSTVHGAGRVMSRTEARGKRNRKTGEILSPGRISHEEMQAWLRDRGVCFRAPTSMKPLRPIAGFPKSSPAMRAR
jgi:tRNA-splicing ligase RtcB